MLVKHLVIYPSGVMEWVELHRERRYDDIYQGDYAYDLKELYNIIGCDFVESVSLKIPDIVILIDESGKVKYPPQHHNELASRLYGGYEFGDYIAGPAIVFRRLNGDICPLSPSDEAFLSLFLGVKLPDK